MRWQRICFKQRNKIKPQKIISNLFDKDFKVMIIKMFTGGLRDLCHIHIIGISEGRKRETREKNIFEDIIANNFPNQRKETELQVQESQSPK